MPKHRNEALRLALLGESTDFLSADDLGILGPFDLKDVWAKAGCKLISAPANGSSFDLDVSGLTKTPKAVLAFIGGPQALDTEEADIQTTIGIADDAGNCASISSSAEDGQTNTDNRRIHSTGSTWRVLNVGGTGTTTPGTITADSDDATAGPIAGGWRCVHNGTSGESYTVAYMLFGGEDLSALVNTWNQSDAIGSASTLTIGFETNLGFVLTCGCPSTTAQTAFIESFGAFSFDGTTIAQWRSTEQSAHNTADSQRRYEIDSSTVVGQGNLSTAWKGEVTNVTSTQVEITTRDTASASDVVSGLFIGLPDGCCAKVGLCDSPTSAASAWAVTDVGFTPQSVVMATGASVVDGGYNQGDNASATSFHVMDANNNAGGIAHLDEDAATVTNQVQFASQEWVRAYTDTNALGWRINPTSCPFTGNGWSVPADDISLADSTGRLWGYAAIKKQ